MIDHAGVEIDKHPEPDRGPAPAISIGLPVYNGELYLRQAIDSVLVQSWCDWELIISDNGSTDGTSVICAEYAARDHRIRYYRYEVNFGAAWNYNHVLAKARGQYFKWLAHDDVILPEYLSKCMEVFSQAPDEVVLVFPSRRWMEPDGRLLGSPPIAAQLDVPGDYHALSVWRLLALSGANFPMLIFGLIRREALKRTRGVGSYNAADLVLSLELRLVGEFWQIAEPLYHQRLHDTSPAQRHRESSVGEAQWYDPFVARKPAWPMLRVVGEMALAVLYSSQNLPRSCALLAWIPVARFIAANQRTLNRLAGAFWRFWGTGSLLGLSCRRVDQLQGRLWCLLTGVRQRDGSLLRLAFSRPWTRANAAVLNFVAQRLARRIEPQATTILEQWRHGNCPIRSQIATEIMGRYPQRFASVAAAPRGGRLISL